MSDSVFSFFFKIDLCVSEDVMHLIQCPIKYFHVDSLYIVKLNSIVSISITKTLLDI